MRTLILLLALAFSALAASAQIRVATFDSLTLSSSDTFYVNYFNPGQDVGFDAGGIHFPSVYDTSFGLNYWDHGFSYSNKTDSVTSGFNNQYSAKTGIGNNLTNKYAVAYGNVNYVFYKPTGKAKSIKGFYITNNTYAYNSMRDGDGFAKKFGGATGLDNDWFKLEIRGILNGQVQSDSVEFYLADFRDPNSANDYIVKTWQWVNLTSLGSVDTLMFTLKSSDTGTFGMNTPAYFCIDDFTTDFTTSIADVSAQLRAKIFPNPSTGKLFVDVENNTVTSIMVMDMGGRLLSSYEVKDKLTAISTELLLSGTYLLQLSNGENKASVRFIKQ